MLKILVKFKENSVGGGAYEYGRDPISNKNFSRHVHVYFNNRLIHETTSHVSRLVNCKGQALAGLCKLLFYPERRKNSEGNNNYK